MPEVIVVATFQTHPEKADQAKEAFTAVIEATHAEEGCRSYALHQVKDDPAHFVLVERWDSQEALDAHFTKPYVAALGAQAADLLAAPPQILFCNPLPAGDAGKGTLGGAA